MFVHLQVHSAYSLLAGPRLPRELVEAAAGMGYKALALTDVDNVYGVHDFAAACREAGIRHGGGRAVLLCRDRRGYETLCLLVTERMRSGDFSLAGALLRVPTGGLAGLAVLTDTESLLDAWAGRVPNLYGLITPFSGTAAAPAARLGLPLAAAGDAAFLDESDEKIHRILRAAADKTSLSGVDEKKLFPKGAVLFPPRTPPASSRTSPRPPPRPKPSRRSAASAASSRASYFPAGPPPQGLGRRIHRPRP